MPNPSSAVFTDADRRELLAHWADGDAAALRARLDSGDSAGFDRELLAGLTARKSPRFFYTPAEVPGRVDWIRAHLPDSAAAAVDRANAVLARRFPLHDGWVAPFSVQLPENFSWLDNPTAEPEFPHVLNRHRFWIDLALAYRLTGDSRYTDELGRHLRTWSRDHTPLADPRDWRNHRPRWWLLDTAIRADTWVWTYFLLLGTPAWTPEINALFIHQLRIHADFLACLTPRDAPDGSGSNWVIMQAQGLLNIAVMFPEFDRSAEWEAHALGTLEDCLRVQFRPDGGHCEQSPDYHIGCIIWLLEPFLLARINGNRRAAALLERLRPACECLYQLLHCDGTGPALSDSDCVPLDLLTEAAIALHEPRWGRFETLTARHVLLFGPPRDATRCEDVRPAAVAFPDTGYYVMRSGDKKRDLQLIFDCGPWGGWHGHVDLLSFELYGFERALLCEPGRLIYDDSPDRHWVTSTPAHNTISVDGVNHATFTQAHDPGFQVDRWDVAADHILVAAHHLGYAHLPGKPVVGRVIWFDRRNTFLICDWGTSEALHEFTVSFTFPGPAVSAVHDGSIHGTAPGGNAWVQALLLPGQTTTREERFWSPVYSQREPAVRFTVNQRTTRFVACALVTAFADEKPVRRSARWAAPPVCGQPVQILLRRDDAEQAVTMETGWHG